MEENKTSARNNIFEKFKNDRDTYSLEIRRNIEKLNNIKDLKEVQIFFLSTRQRLLEDNHTLIDNLSRLKTGYRQKKGKEWENVSNGNMRYQGHEKRYQSSSQTLLSSSKKRQESLIQASACCHCGSVPVAQLPVLMTN